MTTWTLISTFILGVAFGFFGLCATVLYLIHLDEKAMELKKAAKEYAHLYGVTPDLALQIITNHRSK